MYIDSEYFRGAINPARDLGPRLFAFLVFGPVSFSGLAGSASENFFWIPIVGPLIGGVLGALAYDFMIMSHWPEGENDGFDELPMKSE